MSERKSFLLRLSDGLYQDLQAWAEQELRSVNAQIEYLLREAVTRRGRTPPRADGEAGKATSGGGRSGPRGR